MIARFYLLSSKPTKSVSAGCLCGTGLGLVARLVAVSRAWRRGTLRGRSVWWRPWSPLAARDAAALLRGRRGTWRPPPSFHVASVALLALGCVWWRSQATLGSPCLPLATLRLQDGAALQQARNGDCLCLKPTDGMSIFQSSWFHEVHDWVTGWIDPAFCGSVGRWGILMFGVLNLGPFGKVRCIIHGSTPRIPWGSPINASWGHWGWLNHLPTVGRRLARLLCSYCYYCSYCSLSILSHFKSSRTFGCMPHVKRAWATCAPSSPCWGSCCCSSNLRSWRATRKTFFCGFDMFDMSDASWKPKKFEKKRACAVDFPASQHVWAQNPDINAKCFGPYRPPLSDILQGLAQGTSRTADFAILYLCSLRWI